MRALALIIATESLGFRKPRFDSIPNRKGIRIPKGKPKRVCRSTGRSTDPCPRSTGRSTGPKQRAACFQSVHRAIDRSLPRSTERSTGLNLCMSCTPVDLAVDRPSPPVDREHILACCNAPFALVFRSLCYLPLPHLSPLSLQKVCSRCFYGCFTVIGSLIPNSSSSTAHVPQCLQECSCSCCCHRIYIPAGREGEGVSKGMFSFCCSLIH